jgi:hypothetical protein
VHAMPITTNSGHGQVYSTQLYLIHCVSDLRKIDGFLRVLRFRQTIKLTDTIELKYY